MKKPYFCRNFFLIDDVINVSDLLSFYGEHFFGFSGSVVTSLQIKPRKYSAGKYV